MNTKVVATSRGENRVTETSGFEYKSLDICNEEEVLSVVNDIKPNYIINTACNDKRRSVRR